MTLIILATLLVIGIAIFQAYQGLFSAMIMAILTILTAVTAINYYEPLAAAFCGPSSGMTAFYVYPACLAGLFAVSLLVLRVVYDKFIGRAVVLGLWTDRIGGGLMGLVGGMVAVGIWAIAVQMLPMGDAVLGYRPFKNDLTRDQRLGPLRPDDFTIGLANMLSEGSLASGENPLARFGAVHGDLLLELQSQRSTAGKNGRIDATENWIKVKAYAVPDKLGEAWVKQMPSDPRLSEGAATSLYVLRVFVSPDAADADKWLRLPGMAFRLTTNRADGKAGRDCYPLAYMALSPTGWQAMSEPANDDVQQTAMLIVQRQAGDTPLTIDWVYRVPAEERPGCLTFRRAGAIPIGPTPDWNDPNMRSGAMEAPQQPGGK